MRAYSLLGQDVARKNKYMAELACMNPEYREFVAFIDAYNTLNGTEDYKEEREALMKLARGTWPRKELTDLALMVGDKTKYGSFFDTGDKAETD